MKEQGVKDKMNVNIYFSNFVTKKKKQYIYKGESFQD